MAYDDRAVGANVWMKAFVALFDADGSFWLAVCVETGICSHLNPRYKYIQIADGAPRSTCQEMAKYRGKGDLGARTQLERDNTEHILDHQSRVRVCP